MSDDMALVREYATRRSEAAFTELVTRHLGLVHSAAQRRVGDPHLSEEIAQAVFLLLARKAGSLGPGTVLSSWLYRATRYAASDALKIQRRRERREQEASMQSTVNDTSPPAWEQIAPLLEAAMDTLGERDRNAVVLRYFENKPLAEVGVALGVSADAARMRVDRALEKLRGIFAKRGVTLTGAAIAGAVSANAIQAVPVGLAAKISAAAALTGTTLTATTAIVMTTLQKTLIGATLAAAVGTGIYEARQALNARAEIQTLKQQQAPLTEQIQQLNQTLREATNQIAVVREDNQRLNRNTAKLLRLRGEVGQLREGNHPSRVRREGDINAQTNQSREADWQRFIPTESWTLAGRATPEAAIQSFFWAMREGGTNGFQTLLDSMTPELRLKGREESEAVNEEEKLREQWASADFHPQMTGILGTGFRILDRVGVSDDATLLRIQVEGAEKGQIQHFLFKRMEGEWKMAPLRAIN